MKLLIALIFFYASLSAYQVGDSVDKDVAKRLGITDEKIYIVDFFASWCASCEKEIPYISKVNQKIDSSKTEIIGIDVDKDVNKAKEFQATLKDKDALTFRVINDPQNNIIKKFKPIGMPALFYIKDMKVVHVIYGAVDNIDEIILDDLKRLRK